MVRCPLLIVFIASLLWGCSSNKRILRQIEKHVEEQKAEYNILISTTPFILSASIIFLDSTALILDKPHDYKHFYIPTEEDVSWIAKKLERLTYGKLRIGNMKSSVLQYVGYVTKADETKIIVGIINEQYFNSQVSWLLKRHIRFDPIVKSDGGSKYKLYSIEFKKPEGSFLISEIRKWFLFTARSPNYMTLCQIVKLNFPTHQGQFLQIKFA